MIDLNDNIIDPNDTEPTDEELVEIETSIEDIFSIDEDEDDLDFNIIGHA